MGKKIRVTEPQMDRLIKEQLIGGFIAPGNENTYEEKIMGLDYGNFTMHSRKLLDSGKTIGNLVDELTKLPKSEPPDREENNDYEIPRTASGGEPSLPG
jgi:hypothetical protein